MQRTPKTGLLRRWILLPERRKLIIVAVLSILTYAMFQSIFGSSDTTTISVNHVLSEGAGAIPAVVSPPGLSLSRWLHGLPAIVS